MCLNIDQCTSGFPDVNSSEGTAAEEYNNLMVITNLFPHLRFGCTGKIVRMEVASSTGKSEQQSPLIQVWRENGTQSGLYYKPGPDIPIDGSVCDRRSLSDKVFRCTLKENFQVSVQPGDILGLELPPSSNIRFTSDGPANYVFEGRLNTTANISEATNEASDLPKINLLVILGLLLLLVFFMLNLHTCTHKLPVMHTFVTC